MYTLRPSKTKIYGIKGAPKTPRPLAPPSQHPRSKILKLFICKAITMDENIQHVIVASSEKDAKKKFRQRLNDAGIQTKFIFVNELKIDGYEIIVKKV